MKHTIIKFQNSRNERRNFREKKQVLYQGSRNRMPLDFSTAIMEARREWLEYLQDSKGKYFQPKISCSAYQLNVTFSRNQISQNFLAFILRKLMEGMLHQMKEKPFLKKKRFLIPPSAPLSHCSLFIPPPTFPLW